MWRKDIAVFIAPLISPFHFSIQRWLWDFMLQQLVTESLRKMLAAFWQPIHLVPCSIGYSAESQIVWTNFEGTDSICCRSPLNCHFEGCNKKYYLSRKSTLGLNFSTECSLGHGFSMDNVPHTLYIFLCSISKKNYMLRNLIEIQNIDLSEHLMPEHTKCCPTFSQWCANLCFFHNPIL